MIDEVKRHFIRASLHMDRQNGMEAQHSAMQGLTLVQSCDILNDDVKKIKAQLHNINAKLYVLNQGDLIGCMQEMDEVRNISYRYLPQTEIAAYVTVIEGLTRSQAAVQQNESELLLYLNKQITERIAVRLLEEGRPDEAIHEFSKCILLGEGLRRVNGDNFSCHKMTKLYEGRANCAFLIGAAAGGQMMLPLLQLADKDIHDALDCSAMDDPAVLQLAATIKFYLGHFRQSLDFAQRSLSIVEKSAPLEKMIFDLNNILDEETRKRNDSLETEASSQRSRTVSTGSTCSMSNVSTYSEDFTGDGNSQYNDTIKKQTYAAQIKQNFNKKKKNRKRKRNHEDKMPNSMERTSKFASTLEIRDNLENENPEKLLYSQATCQRDSVWVEAKESHSRHRQFDDRNLRTPQKQIRPLHNSHVPQGQQQRGQALKRREQLPPDRAPRYKKQSFHKQQEDGHIQNGSQQQNSRRARPLPPRLARDQKGIPDKRPKWASKKYFDEFTTKGEWKLSCLQCFRPGEVNGQYVKVEVEHACCQDHLMFNLPRVTDNNNILLQVWPIPSDRSPETDQEYAKTEVETKIFNLQKDRSVLENLFHDIKHTRLCLRYSIGQVLRKRSGTYLQLCGPCIKDNNGVAHKDLVKKTHSPECSKGHPWDNNNQLFFQNKDNLIFIHPKGSSYSMVPEDSDIITAIHDLEAKGFSHQIICEEIKGIHDWINLIKQKSEELKQQGIRNSNNMPSDVQVITYDDIEDGRHLKYMGSCPELETLLPAFSNIDRDCNEDLQEDPSPTGYYEVYNVSELQEKLNEEPEKYKHCTIHLEGTQKAICETIDKKQKIEVRGRMNCGKTFEGDEVVVHVMETKVLDDEKTVMRGKVIGVLKQKVRRQEHIFICTVDNYLSCLMRPICGTAPKIHVHDACTRDQNDGDKRNNYVDVHTYDEEYFNVQCLVKVDKQDRDRVLFVVKYLKWGDQFTYPFGYVCQVLPAGKDFSKGKKVLDLMYQVPPILHSEECRTSAKDSISLMEKAMNEEITQRKDLRELNTFTIDPVDCLDIDDAVSIIKLKRDVYEVGVHIADVSYFVSKGEIIDDEAKYRATTYYPHGNQPHHMLPDTFSKGICSLVANKDRLTMSILFTIREDGKVEDYKIMKSVIHSKAKMTYEEAAICIKGTKPSNISETVAEDIRMIERITAKMREDRIQDTRFFTELEDDDVKFVVEENVEAHSMIEELMLLTNRTVADFLMKSYPDYTPIRRQVSPEETRLGEWTDKFKSILPHSLYFSQFACLPREKMSDDNVLLLHRTLGSLRLAIDTGDIKKLRQLITTEQIHPLHAIAMNSWFDLMNPAEFVPSAYMQDDELKHFSLNVSHYTQFTSPIRRYMDIVIHRMVKTALLEDNNECPYSLSEINRLCEHVNTINRRSKQYSRATITLHISCKLTTEAMRMDAIVSEVDDSKANLILPLLPQMKRSQRELLFNKLDVSKKPELLDMGGIGLEWKKRIYDERSFHPYARTAREAMNPVELDPYANIMKVKANAWKNILKALKLKEGKHLQKYVKSMLDNAEYSADNRMNFVRQLTSEVKNNETIVKHHCQFELNLNEGCAMRVQIIARMTKGLLQPCLGLLGMTSDLDICVNHADDPIGCFATVAVTNLKKQYKSVKSYQDIMLPVLSMEAACKAVSEGDPIIINNCHIYLYRGPDGKLMGKCKFSKEFCRKRMIKFTKNSKDEDCEDHDYMCLRVPLEKAGNVWVGHAVQEKASIAETKKKDKENDTITVLFNIHHSSEKVPEELLIRKKNKAHIELINKTLPDRRMEDAVINIEKATEMCKNIALGHPMPTSLKKWKDHYPKSLSLPLNTNPDERRRNDIEDYHHHLPPNNEKQEDAITAAITERFTLIQGPPGTGKTLTGVKVAYWLTRVNQSIREVIGSSGRRQVLYCGPSNSSVDVATNLLQERLGFLCPKIVRVYSDALEHQVFPIPRDVTAKKRGRRYDILDSEQYKKIALHHLIRKESNSFHKDIRAFDKKFKLYQDKPDMVTDVEVEKYTKLIKDASVEEIKKYDVILCTCACSASPRLVTGANVTQVIIDECGMCMEPECLIPLLTFKNIEQVILVGDHKQLQPIIKNNIAKSLGLDQSLFERYSDRAIMLNKQYRMHPKICEFPSYEFYKGELITPDVKFPSWDDHFIPYGVWPNKSFPLVFCHVEGAERTLTVSTSDGNERSKSNIAERDHVVRIYSSLRNMYYVPRKQVTVLSQYKAQCSDIKSNLQDLGMENPQVSTIVASQGDEWNYVIMSTVRSLPEYEIDTKPTLGWLKTNLGFITDHHQINVGLTRARKGLIIVGNKHLLRKDYVWSKLLDFYEQYNCVMDADKFPKRQHFSIDPENEALRWRRKK